jgi:hypothetical protein
VDGFHHFEHHAAGDGHIHRPSAASIAEREQLVWNDEAVMASLARGLADVADGNIRRLDEITDVGLND